MNDSIPVVLGLTVFLLSAVLYVWLGLALSALFRKAGEAGWKGWVPYYNVAVVLQLGGFSPWLIFVALIPFFGQIAFYVLLVMACHRINRAFGLGAGMTVLAAVLFVVWASVLGFGSARWIGAVAAPAGAVRSGGPAMPPPATGPAFAAVPPAFPRPASAAAMPAPPPPPAPAAQWPAESQPTGARAEAFPPPPPAFPPPPAPSYPATGTVAAFPASRPAVAATPAPAAATPSAPVAPAPAFPAFAPSAALDDDLEDSAVAPEDRMPAPPRRSGSFTPPPAPDAAAAPPRPAPEPIASVPGGRAAAAPAPAPAAAVTGVPVPPPAPKAEPWAPAPPTLAVPIVAPAVDDAFPEPSEAVSAVVGAPDAGAPRSARSSVSALYAQPEVPPAFAVPPAPAADDIDATIVSGGAAAVDDDDALERTMIARRRRIPWKLIPPGGAPVDISADVVILGRRPAADAAHPGAQLVSISDETRTVSKTHALLELRGETWFVTDLGSTNGVLFATLMGTEVEAQPGQAIEAGERFFLGDAEVRLTRSDA